MRSRDAEVEAVAEQINNLLGDLSQVVAELNAALDGSKEGQ